MTSTPGFRRAVRRACAPALLLVALSLVGCGAGEPVAGGGDPLPEFRLASLAGEQMGNAELAGKVVLLDFWATWCAPCHLQADILRELYPEVSGRGVEFVAIAVGEPEDVVRDFVAEHPFPYPALVDPEDEMSAKLRILGLPTLIVVDREGKIVYRNLGISDRQALLAAFERAGA